MYVSPRFGDSWGGTPAERRPSVADPRSDTPDTPLPTVVALVQAMGPPSALIDVGGRLVSWNPSWEDTYPGLGEEWLDLCEQMAASGFPGAGVTRNVADGVRAVCEGGLPAFHLEFADWRGASSMVATPEQRAQSRIPLPKPGARQRWFALSARRIPGWPGALIVRSDVTSRYAAEGPVTLHERFDPLTGLLSRAGLRERLALTLSTPSGQGPALLIADLDGFKAVNDGLGHLAGDEVLVEATRRFHTACADLLSAADADRMPALARLGGDEFAVLLPEADLTTAEQLANRLVELHETPFEVAGLQLSLGISVGVAVADDEHNTPGDVMRDADAAMNLAKSSGRGRHEVFGNELREGAVRRLRVLDRLRAALENPLGHGLRLDYQPIVSMRDGQVHAYEALARWEDDSLGRVTPLEFIGLAEDTGMIVAIGAWAIVQACTEMRSRPGMRVSVNVSPRQLADRRLLETVDEALAVTGFDPRLLTLELTESAVVSDVRGAAETLGALRTRGINLALDDFGTGWSSLGQLRRLPMDRLKVDRVFVEALGHDASAEGVVRAIVALASGLGMRVTAEGVETQEQLDRLRDLGVDDAQGYLLGRPGPLPVPGEETPAAGGPALIPAQGAVPQTEAAASEGVGGALTA